MSNINNLKDKPDETTSEFVKLCSDLEKQSRALAKVNNAQEMPAAFCEWYLGKLNDLKKQRERLDERYELLKRQITNEQKALQFVHGKEFKSRITAMTDATPGKKSVNFLTGRAGYRTSRETLEIKEESKELIIWCSRNCPNALRYRTSILKTPILEHIRATGEMPPDCKLNEPMETFYPWIESDYQLEHRKEQEHAELREPEGQ